MLYKETVEPAILGLLTELMRMPELKQFRLVGGTALSLLLGQRGSIDLDLFTDSSFDKESIVNKLTETYSSFLFRKIKVQDYFSLILIM